MAFSERDLSTYIDVAQRIADFRERYPEGSLRPLNPSEPYRLVQADGFDKDGSAMQQSFVVVIAAAYRTPTDPAPGVGMAWEIFPGRTPYTRGSELQNAETSAWGRAIIAVGASDSKAGIASREEVRNRQAEREDCGLVGCPVGESHRHDSYGLVIFTNKDGSLSRSRTTDEQKAAAGVMTDPEQRAHNKLAKAPPNSQPVDRLIPSIGPAADDKDWNSAEDAWYDAATPLADLTNPEDRHGTATADQIRSLQAAFTAHSIKDREDKIQWLQARFGSVHSSKDLSYTQAAAALQELAR